MVSCGLIKIKLKSVFLNCLIYIYIYIIYMSKLIVKFIFFLLLFQHMRRNNILKQPMVGKKSRIWVAQSFVLKQSGHVRCSDEAAVVIDG